MTSPISSPQPIIPHGRHADGHVRPGAQEHTVLLKWQRRRLGPLQPLQPPPLPAQLSPCAVQQFASVPARAPDGVCAALPAQLAKWYSTILAFVVILHGHGQFGIR